MKNEGVLPQGWNVWISICHWNGFPLTQALPVSSWQAGSEEDRRLCDGSLHDNEKTKTKQIQVANKYSPRSLVWVFDSHRFLFSLIHQFVNLLNCSFMVLPGFSPIPRRPRPKRDVDSKRFRQFSIRQTCLLAKSSANQLALWKKSLFVWTRKVSLVENGRHEHLQHSISRWGPIAIYWPNPNWPSWCITFPGKLMSQTTWVTSKPAVFVVGRNCRSHVRGWKVA